MWVSGGRDINGASFPLYSDIPKTSGDPGPIIVEMHMSDSSFLNVDGRRDDDHEDRPTTIELKGAFPKTTFGMENGFDYDVSVILT